MQSLGWSLHHQTRQQVWSAIPPLIGPSPRFPQFLRAALFIHQKKLWVRFFTQIIPKKNCVVFYNTLGTSQFRSPIGGKVATESSPFSAVFPQQVFPNVYSPLHTPVYAFTQWIPFTYNQPKCKKMIFQIHPYDHSYQKRDKPRIIIFMVPNLYFFFETPDINIMWRNWWST